VRRREFIAEANFSDVESYAVHRDRLASKGGDFDPIVRSRIERGGSMSAADFILMMRERARLVRAMDMRLEDLDALVLPTMPTAAPKLSEVGTPETFLAKQAILVRNTNWVNFFDLCAISLPLPRAGGLPVGLMLVARNGHDHRLFRIAAAVERLFAG
jgi:aspartyl-tRNA(Asn)/glutamyl-tRNA(Gln) amidotransferase subunit A